MRALTLKDEEQGKEIDAGLNSPDYLCRMLSEHPVAFFLVYCVCDALSVETITSPVSIPTCIGSILVSVKEIGERHRGLLITAAASRGFAGGPCAAEMPGNSSLIARAVSHLNSLQKSPNYSPWFANNLGETRASPPR